MAKKSKKPTKTPTKFKYVLDAFIELDTKLSRAHVKHLVEAALEEVRGYVHSRGGSGLAVSTGVKVLKARVRSVDLD